MSISIGKLRGGFCVYWRDGDGKRHRHKLASRTRKEAEAEALDVYRRKTWHPIEPTIANCLDAYAEFLGGRPAGVTLGYIAPILKAHFGAMRPDHVTRKDCTGYEAARTETGRSPGTVHTELGFLRSAMNYATKAGMIQRAPYIWRPAKPIPKERFLTHGEITRILDAAAAPHIKLAMILLLGTAGRVGAILDLTWDRIDFERGIINLRLPDSRTRKGRAIVPMNGMTRAALQTAHDAALSEYVVEYAGGPVKSIRKGVANAAERAGLDGVTIHVFRHTAAVHMVSAGIPMQKVSQYLGHSNTATTERVYARFAPDHLSDAAEVLNFTALKRRGA